MPYPDDLDEWKAQREADARLLHEIEHDDRVGRAFGAHPAADNRDRPASEPLWWAGGMRVECCGLVTTAEATRIDYLRALVGKSVAIECSRCKRATVLPIARRVVARWLFDAFRKRARKAAGVVDVGYADGLPAVLTVLAGAVAYLWSGSVPRAAYTVAAVGLTVIAIRAVLYWRLRRAERAERAFLALRSREHEQDRNGP